MARARAGAPGDALSDQQPLRISVLGNGLDPILLAGVKDGRFTNTKALAATWRVSEGSNPTRSASQPVIFTFSSENSKIPRTSAKFVRFKGTGEAQIRPQAADP